MRVKACYLQRVIWNTDLMRVAKRKELQILLLLCAALVTGTRWRSTLQTIQTKD